MGSIQENARYVKLSDLDKLAPPILVKALIIYELLPSTDLTELIASLKGGLENAVNQFPFMAGSLQPDESGHPCIVTSPDMSVDFTVCHLSSTEHKPFSELAEHSFPPENLEYTQLLPETTAGRQPVSALRLNVIEGGLILVFTMHHTAGDWASIDAFLSILCRGTKAHYHNLETPSHTPDLNKDPYTGKDPAPGTSQKDLLEKYPSYYIMDMANFNPPKPTATYRGRIYQITDSAVQELKRQCTNLPEDVEFVSSYDCISALLWTSITRARLSFHPENISKQSLLLHPINLRSRDPENVTSQEYFGNAIIPAHAGSVDVKALAAEDGIRIAASLIRRSINEVSLTSIKDLTSLVRTLSPTQRLGYHSDFHDTDILMNTWYSGTAENYDLGFGSPRAVRLHRPITGACCCILPNFSPSSTRVYELFTQLREEEHEFLQQDAEFLRYFKFIA